MSKLSGIRNPNLYHGHGAKPPFFEGWYFKLVDAAETHRYAVIPGVFIGNEPESTHAFVQTLDGVTGRSTFNRYPFSEFSAAKDEFDIRVGPNHFRAEQISLNIATPEISMRGELRFSGLTPWKVTLASPGIMGWYAYMPFMECYHGVVSLDHEISGQLAVDGVDYDFTGGRGYIEKDWGQAFPKAWIWMQTNHFAQRGVSLTASVAIIPWLRSAFPGFIIGLWHAGQLYRFATYTGAVTKRLDLSDTHVVWHIVGRAGARGAQHRLEIEALRTAGGLLHSPERVAMQQRVMESLTAQVGVRLIELTGGRERIVYEDTGKHAGLEIVGPIEEIQKMAALKDE